MLLRLPLARCRHLTLKLGVVALRRSARSLERCFRSDQPLLSPLKDIPATIDRLLLTPYDVRHAFSQSSRTLVKLQLAVSQSLFLVIELDLACVARRFPMIRHVVAIIGNSIPLVGDSLPLVLSRV